MEKHPIKNVSVVGLGKLGAPIAAAIASKGFDVIGLDVAMPSVDALKNHRAPVTETGLQELITAGKAHISATQDYTEMVMKTDATFIVVPTPSDANGAFMAKFVVDAAAKIGAALAQKNSFHIVAVVSTMMPGSSDTEVIPALERASGKKAGKDFGYCYNPTLIALGSVIKDFLHPDLVMLGESDTATGAALEEFYGTVLASKPVFHHVKPIEAELAKISINTFITAKISFANMLGEISERYAGVNVDNVLKVVGSDSRIGSKYLRAGTPFGGPCFPRDNRALAFAAESVGVPAHIPHATDAVNKDQIAGMADRIGGMLGASRGTVGVVGVAYKPNTDVVEESAGMRLVVALQANGVPVLVYDEMARENAKKAFLDSVSYADSLEDCFNRSEIIVITNPYQELAARITPAMAKGKMIIDYWRVLHGKGQSDKGTVVPFGINLA